jgi:hypothetical protein
MSCNLNMRESPVGTKLVVLVVYINLTSSTSGTTGTNSIITPEQWKQGF